MNTYMLSAIRQLQEFLYNLLNNPEKITGSDLFYGNYADVKELYVKKFRRLPSVKFVNHIDPEKAYEFFLNKNAGKIRRTYRRAYYNWQENKQEFSISIIELSGQFLIELGKEYAEFLFHQRDAERADQLVEALLAFRTEKEEGEPQIHIINQTTQGLELKELTINPSELAVERYYNDDFIAVDALIQERLKKEQDKGIVLLHGLPGTGKTTYLRYLIGQVKKKVLFLSPSVAGNLMNPDFIDLLIENPNSILVIEDAENIILDRTYRSNHSVSNLLNISDGLLSDCLNVQIICTFNSALNLVDKALLRKGRLIAHYEFGKLSVEKAKQLAIDLNLDVSVEAPMTLAELTNPATTNYETPKTEIIGFRRVVATN